MDGALTLSGHNNGGAKGGGGEYGNQWACVENNT